MLVNIGLDSGALSSISAQSTAALVGVHRELIQLLVDHAVLVVADREDESALRGAVSSLPLPVRKLWSTALDRLDIIDAAPSTNLSLLNVADAATLRDHWGGRVSVAYLSDAKAALLGCSPEEVTTVEPLSGIELTRIGYPRESERVRAHARLSSLDVATGTRREAVWRERFRGSRVCCHDDHRRGSLCGD